MIKEEKDNNHTNQIHDTSESITRVTGMYKDWFLDYASYVILERAVPAIEDGFKPVQRRIMQSMKDLDDGRYNKVANNLKTKSKVSAIFENNNDYVIYQEFAQ